MDGNNSQFTYQPQGQPVQPQQFQPQVPPQGMPSGSYRQAYDPYRQQASQYGNNPYAQQTPQTGYNPYAQQAPQYGYNPYAQQAPQNGYNPYAQQMQGQSFDPFFLPRQAPFDKKSAKKHFSGIGLSYFVFSIVAAAVQIIVSIVVDIIDPGLWDNYLFMMLGSILPMYLVGAPICILMMKRLPSEKPDKAPWGFGKFIAGLVTAFGLMYIGSFIGTYLGLLIESVAPDATASTNTVQELVFSGDMVVNITFMVIIGPIVEELLFRKLLCDRLRIYGEGITVAVTGFLFGLFHGNLTQFIYASLLGCLLAYVYMKSGRISITIAYHIIINFVGSIVPLILLRSVDIDELTELMEAGDNEVLTEYAMENLGGILGYSLFALAVFGCMIVSIILLIVFGATGKIKFRPGRFTIPSGKRFAVAFINVGMILFILVEIGEILINMFA